MEVKAPRPVPSTIASCSDDDLYSSTSSPIIEKVKEAERAFVEQKFRKALQLGNQLLRDLSQGSYVMPPSKASLVHLQTEPVSSELSSNHYVISEDRSFLVDISSSISPIDQAAVVSLQCCFELYFNGSKRKKACEHAKSIQPFLNYYCSARKRAMPLEVSVVWIEFCHGAGFNQTAVEMAAELLHVLLSRDSVGMEENCDSRDELLWFLLTKALPHSGNLGYVEDVFDRIQANSWTPFEASFVSCAHPVKESISTILSRLDGLSKQGSGGKGLTKCITQCQKELETMLNELDGNLDQAQIEEGDGTNPIIPSSVQLPMTHPGWKRQLAKRILHFFRTQVIIPLYSSEERWANRGQVAFSALMTYLAWKRRRRIQSATQSVGQIIISPIQEIIEALLPQR